MMAADDIDAFIALLRGLAISLQLAAAVLVIGMLGGTFLGLMASFGGRLARFAVTALLYLARGLPLLMQVFAVFYILPLFGISFDRFSTATLALGLFASVTLGEIIRAGILGVGRGQAEAAQALGMTRLQVIGLIVLPQAVRAVLAPLVGQFVFLIKATSIISLLGVPELMLAAREIIERTLEGAKVMGMVWLLYTAVCLPLSFFGRWLEQRLRTPNGSAAQAAAPGSNSFLPTPALRSETQ